MIDEIDDTGIVLENGQRLEFKQLGRILRELAQSVPKWDQNETTKMTNVGIFLETKAN